MKGSLKIWMVILGMVVTGIGITFLTNSYVSRQIEKMAETSGAGKARAEMVQEDAVESARTAGVPAENGGTENIAAEGVRTAEAAEGVRAEEADAEDGKAAESSAETAELYGQEIGAEADIQTEKDGTAEKFEPTETEDDKAVSRKLSEGFSQEEAMDEQTAEDSVNFELRVVEYSYDLQKELGEYQEWFSQLDLQIEQMRKSETENNMYSVKTAAQTERRIWERELDGLYRLLCDSLEETAAQELKKEQQEWQQVRDSRAEEAAKKNSGGSLESVDYIASIAASNRERAYALLEKYMEE